MLRCAKLLCAQNFHSVRKISTVSEKFQEKKMKIGQLRNLEIGHLRKNQGWI